ncbi:MAG: OsmC family protein [Alphaproteobacteria bacterium]|nr:OsmC family protein [Alphaproteobacteria bacterium]MDP3532954.1 OsmC family protein [Alphaproteobacteria bacterium]
MSKQHHYEISLCWTGNNGTGTSGYTTYERSHIVQVLGKPHILCSSDPLFRGDSAKWNPEELLLASIANCHMLWYLHLCADNSIIIHSYKDNPVGVMKLEKNGSGKFIEVTLNPKIVISEQEKKTMAIDLHHKAHEYCFIANSVNFPVLINPIIELI